MRNFPTLKKRNSSHQIEFVYYSINKEKKNKGYDKSKHQRIR